jgi:pimeloyl-ACP methyl ester carboxylesterase
VPTAAIDGITTRYEVHGSGPPLLMLSPGGFDGALEKWTNLGVYSRILPMEHLPQRYTCIIFDRRESGESGGRVERITWEKYADQAKGLMDHLNIEKAHLMGGCMGCSPEISLAVRYPERVKSMVLYWPTGGALWRISGQRRFTDHVGYVQDNGLNGVVALAKEKGSFGADSRTGPWASAIATDESFAKEFAAMDAERYQSLVTLIGRTLIDRDTVPGAEPEELLEVQIPSLIIPGQDAAHATSAARYLEEVLPQAQYWDVPISGQTAETAWKRVPEFLDAVEASS